LSIAADHTTIQHLPVKRRSRNQNAIIRSFVASKRKYLFFKRIFDLVASFLTITFILSWLTPIVALLIKLDSKGPVFFTQKRIGLGGKQFKCIKFRTMVSNEEADQRQAQENDERITRIGRLLRRINLDELPQFLNVFLGHMSIVGPRPHMLADCIRFSFVISSYQFRNLVRPGITGLAQVNGYHGATPDYESIIIRYYWDAQYVRKAGLWLDIKIIALTMAQGCRNMAALCISAFRKKRVAVITEMQEVSKSNTLTS
jgi:putative colanic acid biosysnthesis UDP-glucose lipid carrier transferase